MRFALDDERADPRRRPSLWAATSYKRASGEVQCGDKRTVTEETSVIVRALCKLVKHLELAQLTEKRWEDIRAKT